MFERKTYDYKIPEDYRISGDRFNTVLENIRMYREELLERVFDDYLTNVHGLSLQCLLHVQDSIHNMKLKHFKVVEYVQENKAYYFFKGELIFVIYFDNLQWKCDVCY